MENAITKIFKLVQETGEHFIITDVEGKNAFVVMPLEEYRGLKSKKAPAVVATTSVAQPTSISDKSDLANLTEEQLLNKINAEIAVWKNAQVTETLAEKLPAMSQPQAPALAESIVNPALDEKPEQKEETFYFEPVDDGK